MSVKLTEEEFAEVVQRCVERYEEVLLEDAVLDLEEIEGPLRQKVLKDAVFRKKVSRINAVENVKTIQTYKKMLNNIEQTLGKFLDKPAIRGEKTNTKESVALIAQYTKLSEMLLKLQETKGIEENTINFLFVPITQEEFEASVQVEKHEGQEFEGDVFDALITEGAAAAEKEKIRRKEEQEENEEVLPYVIHADGTIEG